jgi:hypothetical protein
VVSGSSYRGWLGKEVRDEVVYGGFDWEDLATTIVGGFIMQIFIWLNV